MFDGGQTCLGNNQFVFFVTDKNYDFLLAGIIEDWIIAREKLTVKNLENVLIFGFGKRCWMLNVYDLVFEIPLLLDDY